MAGPFHHVREAAEVLFINSAVLAFLHVVEVYHYAVGTLQLLIAIASLGYTSIRFLRVYDEWQEYRAWRSKKGKKGPPPKSSDSD